MGIVDLVVPDHRSMEHRWRHRVLSGCIAEGLASLRIRTWYLASDDLGWSRHNLRFFRQSVQGRKSVSGVTVETNSAINSAACSRSVRLTTSFGLCM